MLCEIWRKGWISLALMTVLLVLMLLPIADTYKVVLSQVDIQQEGSNGELLIVAHGSNMLRANSFYLDGKRVEDCRVSKGTYEECHIFVNQEIFDEVGEWYRLELGFSKWGIVELIGTPIWIEWQIP